MNKIIRIGTTSQGNVFCKIKIEDKNGFKSLSISGVEGPKSNGDASSCGQIEMGLAPKDFKSLAPGWTETLLEEFLAIWRRWHLNYMRPGCVHQQTEIEEKKDKKILVEKFTVFLYTYRLEKELEDATDTNEGARIGKKIVEARQAFKEVCGDNWLKLRGRHLWSEEERKKIEPYINVEKVEEKSPLWVSPEEHPEGMLGKECLECGYHYGSAWRKEELPADVIDFLKRLPLTDKTPAWV